MPIQTKHTVFRWFLLLALCWLAPNAYAAGKANKLPAQLPQQLFWLDTQVEAFNLDSLQACQQTGCTLATQTIKKQRPYWLKVPLKQLGGHAQSWNFVLGPRTKYSHVDFYLVHNKQLIQHSKAGWFDRYKTDYHGKLSRIEFSLIPDADYQLYICIRQEHMHTLAFDAAIHTSRWVLDWLYMKNLQSGLFHGMLWVMFLYNLLIYFSTRELQYLYYALYIISASLQFLFSENLLVEWFDFPPRFQNLSAIVGLNTGPIFYFLFAFKFVDFRSHCPKWTKPIQIAIGINLASIVFESVFWLGTFNFPPLALYVSIKVSLLAVFLIALNIRLLLARNQIINYFVSGSLILWGSIIFGSVAYIWLNALNLVTWTQVGIVSELIIFSLGLGYKIRLTERERKKSAEALIKQLKLNKKLQQHVNEELEEAVTQRTQEILRQKQDIEEHQRSITSSITYAQRIQRAVFPAGEKLNRYFPDGFVLWKPRDIVSGDFFWIKQTEDNIVWAAADCTGHGVPGAFMSMLAVSILSEIERNKGLNNPGEILNEMRERTKASLNTQTDSMQNRDGLDIALLIYNTTNNELQFAGANNPLYVISTRPDKLGRISTDATNSPRRLHELKGTKNPIGLYVKEIPFKTQKLKLQEGDSLYIFSDGFVDQFNQQQDRKFSSKRFKQLLLAIDHLPAPVRKQKLDDAFSAWKGNTDQIDDVLVVGVKI